MSGDRDEASAHVAAGFSEQIEVLLVIQGKTRSDLARATGRSRSHITQVLKRGANPTVSTMAQFAGALGYEVHIVLERKSKA